MNRPVIVDQADLYQIYVVAAMWLRVNPDNPNAVSVRAALQRTKEAAGFMPTAPPLGQFRCTTCGNRYDNMESLHKHRRERHPEEEQAR